MKNLVTAAIYATFSKIGSMKRFLRAIAKISVFLVILLMEAGEISLTGREGSESLKIIENMMKKRFKTFSNPSSVQIAKTIECFIYNFSAF